MDAFALLLAMMIGQVQDYEEPPVAETTIWPKMLYVHLVKDEILDEREVDRLSRMSLFENLKEISARIQEVDHLPRVGYDCNLFPDRKWLNATLEFNRSFRKSWVDRLEVDSIYVDDLKDAISECDQLYHLYDTVRDAQCEYYYISVRRHALADLRKMLGDEWYYSGRLPPCVPLRHIPYGR